MRYCTTRNGRALYGWRVHMQLDLKTFTPRRFDRTGACSSGENRETRVLAASLEAGRCYVIDGNYADSKLLDQIIDAKSSYVVRFKENFVFEVLEERLLSQEALDADIVRDAIVQWGGEYPMRIVELKVTPSPRRGGKDSPPTDVLLIGTNMLDLPVDLVALIYRQRYSVELFFRTFKQLLGLRHLLSQRKEGFDIQVYCAVIVCLLINLMTGRKPDKHTVNMIAFYLLGLADQEELLAYLNRPDNKGVKTRAKEALWKKIL
jgi:hypothetical protein